MQRMHALRLPRHRATTANLSSIYPFQTEEGFGPRGVYLGVNVLAGGAPFMYDPFELYTQGVITSPNMCVVGMVGSGKSSAIKTMLYRSLGVFGSPGGQNRWAAILDPKGEYGPLAESLGLQVLRLRPGGAVRLNPLDAGPHRHELSRDDLTARRVALVNALTEGVLRRDLTPIEDAGLGWAVEAVADEQSPTLADIVRLVTSPTKDMATRALKDASHLREDLESVRYALSKLLDRELRGMFDGPSTIDVGWQGRGIVIDLSAIYHDPDALTLVMIAATAWLQSIMASSMHNAPRRVQVIEECWALLANEQVVRYFQGCFKLSRSYGVQNIIVAHNLSSIRAQANDGSSTEKVAMGLLADTQTHVLFRQPHDQVSISKEMLGLTTPESLLLPELVRGRSLWKIAGRPAVVQHVIGAGEWTFCDTDAQLSLRENSDGAAV